MTQRRSPGIWFPRPRSAADLRPVDECAGLTVAELFALLTDPAAIELRQKVGVVSPQDGSAKLTARLLQSGGWFFKTDTGRRVGPGEGNVTEDSELPRPPAPADLVTEAATAAHTERTLGIWHPRKGRFCLWSQGFWWPVTVCPCLVTLRQLDTFARKSRAWAQVLTLALNVRREHGVGLDLNPANFGFAPDQPDLLYYLDDELYPSATLRDFAEALASRIPEEPTVSPKEWQAWGQTLVPIFAGVCQSLSDWLELLEGLHAYPLTQRFQEAALSLASGLATGHPRLARHYAQHSRTPAAVLAPAPAPTPAAVLAPAPAPTPAALADVTAALADVTAAPADVTAAPASTPALVPAPPTAAVPQPRSQSPLVSPLVRPPEPATVEPPSNEPAPSEPPLSAPMPELEPLLDVPRLVQPRRGGLTCIFADVHANLPALDAVLRAADELGVDDLLFLGDVVGYGPFPGECIERLANLPRAVLLRGNHDQMVATGIPEDGANRIARQAAQWTHAQLTPAQRQWLAALPVEYRGPNWLAVHGAPTCPQRFYAYIYELTFRDNLDWLQAHGVPVCFYGHSHVQFVHRRYQDHDERLAPSDSRLFEPGEVLLINPGSVGQPRDGDPRAAFAIWDRQTNRLTFHRVEYDIETTLRAIRAAGLPDDLANRLEIGR
jgi:diadenosine tetraphosphatase ApaH/serine/threonine PP2A family protein phosphatase